MALPRVEVTSPRRGWVYVTLVAVAVVVGIAVTACAEVPDKLPSVALGSTALLHVERAVAVFAALFLLIVILARAWEGQLPSEISGRGFKYASDAEAALADAKGAAEGIAVSEQLDEEQEREKEKSDGQDLLALRIKLEAKMSYIAKYVLRPPGSDAPTFLTVGSLAYDGYLTDQEARTAARILTLPDEELDVLPPSERRAFYKDADRVARNLRAGVFHGLTREVLKKNDWEVEDVPTEGTRRAHLLAKKGSECHRVAPCFAVRRSSNFLVRAKKRLQEEANAGLEGGSGVIVIPDHTNTPSESDADPPVLRLAEFQKRLDLNNDPRTL